ncbi:MULTISPECIES: NAD(P)H-dependent oxidoreductase [unclassified Arthrobacter]|uniref:NAD(P)H-dependent oxidoreductase n=1 Tax=unclassified Arthrobacter TaxID=235627 RepID=UPI00031D78DD|nr:MULTISPECIES: NAD(P)H-dependent oxidoreductase [unclassified Arthrobacter]PVE18740.1 FMN reductase [Arthrobacter sp. Bz4]
MSRPLRVVVVNGSPTQRSKTMGLVKLITESLSQKLAIEVHQTNVYHLGPSFTGAISRADLDPAVEAEYAAVESADLLIAATPVYRGSYAGMFKHFFDLVGQYSLTNTPVILVATGGSDRHALVIEHALRPLFGFFQAATIPVGFYANSGDFDGDLVLNAEVYSRIEVGLGDVIDSLHQTVNR